MTSHVSPALWQKTWPKLLSHSDLKHSLRFRSLGRRYFNRQAAFNGFAQVNQQFIHGFTLGGATRYRWNFCPKAAFFGVMDYRFDFHAITPATNVGVCLAFAKSNPHFHSTQRRFAEDGKLLLGWSYGGGLRGKGLSRGLLNDVKQRDWAFTTNHGLYRLARK